MTTRDVLEIAVAILLFWAGTTMGHVGGRAHSLSMLFAAVKERIALSTSPAVQEELFRLYNEMWRREFGGCSDVGRLHVTTD